MNNFDRIMHLRAINGYTLKERKEYCHGNNTIEVTHPQFDLTKRGITVVGDFVVNEERGGVDIVFAWTIQSPKDQYNKRKGIDEASRRMNGQSSNDLIIQTNFDASFPLKYQFFNAVANCREYFHREENHDKVAYRRFLDLTFYALAEIAENNDWFFDIESRSIPSIHPDILINYIHRMNKAQMKLDGVYKLIGRSPILTDMCNRMNGVY